MKGEKKTNLQQDAYAGFHFMYFLITAQRSYTQF
jgi:hypothetical protein